MLCGHASDRPLLYSLYHQVLLLFSFPTCTLPISTIVRFAALQGRSFPASCFLLCYQSPLLLTSPVFLSCMEARTCKKRKGGLKLSRPRKRERVVWFMVFLGNGKKDQIPLLFPINVINFLLIERQYLIFFAVNTLPTRTRFLTSS